MEKIEIPRLIIYSSTICNLRCKLCSEYIPYISDYQLSYPAERVKKALYELFQIISCTNIITISGGEPLLNDSTADITEFLAQFSNQYNKLEVMTNGTLKPSRRLLEALAENNKGLLFINDYGELSPRVSEIADLCAKWNIRYKVRIYHGENAHCGGWYDMALLSGVRLTDDVALQDRFAHCQTGNNPRLGLSFGLFSGKLFACSMSGIVERLGLMDDTRAYIDLCDDTLSYAQKRDYIVTMQSQDYLPACAVCCGNDGRIEVGRFVPAEQLC